MSSQPDFADHFSSQARAYRRHRPGYPPALFDHLAGICPATERAWDCGCGSGQASRDLSTRFRQVIATDPSAAQIAEADPAPNIVYRVAAESDPLIEPGTIDLVTAAQAAHWFNHPRFHAEVRRVLKPGGILAMWTYGLPQVNAAVDACVARYHRSIVGSFWPPERAHVDSGYSELPFPFADIPVPRFIHETLWTLNELMEHLGTWSSTKYFRERNGTEPLDLIRAVLQDAWGSPEVPAPVRWPIRLRVGRQPGL
jgi:SAM-dependent methyltransferase